MIFPSMISLVPSKEYRESEKINIPYHDGNEQATIKNTNNGDQQCYLEQVLSPNTNYLIQLSYHHIQLSYAWFRCGLISEENKDVSNLANDNIYFDQQDSGCTDKMIKGKNMKTGNDHATGTHDYEIHINIKDKIFRICSTNYVNCQELDDKNYFDEGKQYYFAIYLSSAKDSAFLSKLYKVKEFPDILK